MATVYVGERELEAIIHFTDRGGWRSSDHWQRDKLGRLTTIGARAVLADLGAEGDVEVAVQEAIEHITKQVRERYRLAALVRERLELSEAQEIADTHGEGCQCEMLRGLI